jgi:hypothetical protein
MYLGKHSNACHTKALILLYPTYTHAAFSIDDSGVITSEMVLDRESINKYTLIITASDGAPEPDTRTGTANVTILINDENDNSPRFTSGAVLSASPVEVHEVTLAFNTINSSSETLE